MKKIVIKDYPFEQYVEIEGIKYSYLLFEELGLNGMPLDTVFKLKKRNNGLLTIERIENKEKGDNHA